MNATRAAALPRYRTENPGFPRENRLYRTGKPARFRPDLRVVYRAGSPVAVAPAASSAAAPSVSVHPAAAPPAAAPPAPARPAPAPARPAPAQPAQARPGVSPSSATSPLRLTRRGRIVVAVMAALLVAGLSLAVAGAAQATGHSAWQRATGPNLARVVVRPGQTLWSVAENADPNADPRLVIQQIAQLNALTSDNLVAGQRLWVPRS
jgi:LysM domain